jgi:hypothetical protein
MWSGGARQDNTLLLREMVRFQSEGIERGILTDVMIMESEDGTIIIWHQVESRAEIATFGEDEEEEKAHEKEFWKEKRMIV